MKKKGPMGDEGDEIPQEVKEKLSELNKEMVSVLNVSILKKIVAAIDKEMSANNKELQVPLHSISSDWL